MRRLAHQSRIAMSVVVLAALLELGCKDKSERGSNRAPTAAKTAPLAAPLTWSPPTAAALFHSRPAESWEETGLDLADYVLEISTAGGIATSTLDLKISNPTNTQVEAVIRLPIPPDAAVTAATLWVGDDPMNGVLLNRDAAREVYDKIVDRRRDPLLVEWGGSELLQVSVFPVEPAATRRFTLTWVEPMVGGRVWVASFHHKGRAIGYPSAIEVDGEPSTRDGDWVIVPPVTELSEGDFRLETQSRVDPSMVSVVLDATRRATMSRAEQWTAVEDLVASLGGRAPVALLAADWFVTELGRADTAEELAAAKAAFSSIRQAGRLDSIQAAEQALDRAGATGAIALVGVRDPQSVTRAAGGERVPTYWVARVPSDPVGTDRGPGHGGRFLDGTAVGNIARALLEPTTPGFDWAPLDTATGHVAWLGRRRDAAVPGDGKPTPLEALFYRALLSRDAIPPGKIVSPMTSILVLESKEHYQKWGIDPEHPPQTAPPRPAPQGAGWGTLRPGRYGTLGNGGQSGSGYAIGAGRGGMRGVSRPRPQLRVGRSTAKGDLDSNIIRRYLRRKLPRLSYCYEKQLITYPDLGGTATATWTIEPDGSTANARVALDVAYARDLVSCVAETLASISFPKPRDGRPVEVQQVFRLIPIIDERWKEARTLLDSDAAGVVGKIAKQFALEGVKDESELAWRLAETELAGVVPQTHACVVVATLLKRQSDSEARDARRILSECIDRSPEVVADLFRQWGFEADAGRVEALAEKQLLGSP